MITDWLCDLCRNGNSWGRDKSCYAGILWLEQACSRWTLWQNKRVSSCDWLGSLERFGDGEEKTCDQCTSWTFTKFPALGIGVALDGWSCWRVMSVWTSTYCKIYHFLISCLVQYFAWRARHQHYIGSGEMQKNVDFSLNRIIEFATDLKWFTSIGSRTMASHLIWGNAEECWF